MNGNSIARAWRRPRPVENGWLDKISLGVDRAWIRWVFAPDARSRPGGLLRARCASRMVTRLAEYLVEDPRGIRFSALSKERILFRVLTGRIPLRSMEIEGALARAQGCEPPDADFFECYAQAIREKNWIESFSDQQIWHMSRLQVFLMTRWDHGREGLQPLCRYDLRTLTEACQRSLRMPDLSEPAAEKTRIRLDLPYVRREKIRSLCGSKNQDHFLQRPSNYCKLLIFGTCRSAPQIQLKIDFLPRNACWVHKSQGTML